MTLWPLEPHTLGKHKVLRRYLEAWYPILSRFNNRIIYIDGFSGPGEYSGGEPGSPIIAIQTLLTHPARSRIPEIGFLFIEEREDRHKHLEALLVPLRPTLPGTSWATCIHGLFDDRLSQVLDELNEQEKNMAPCFVMIDPFGVAGLPMNVISRILRNPKSEVYISFMYESINRFRDTPQFERHLDELFGTPTWRDGIDMPESNERKKFFFGLYEEQLRRAGAIHVLHFELYEGNRLVYAIFFGSQHEVGCNRMKEAIWKIAPWGDFAFRPVRTPQLTLGIETPDYALFQNQIAEEFSGKGWVTIEQVEQFARSDKTPFYTGQLKTRALVPMEKSGGIEIDPTSRKRVLTFPPGTRFRIT
jgi:three-Cys-motif partner protein